MAVGRTRSGRFAAQVVHHGKQVWLGVYTSEQRARLACCIWRSKHLDEAEAELAETKSEIQLGFSKSWRHKSPQERKECIRISRRQQH